MRRLPVLFLSVLFVLCSATLADERLYCSVGLSEVAPTATSTTDIHSAGVVRALDTAGIILWSSTVASDHNIELQTTGQTIAIDFGVSAGEVHTYARTTVNKGYAYEAHLFGRDRTRNLTQTCAKFLLLESPDPPPVEPAIQGCAPECGSPILIDLDRGGFVFTDVEDGVDFDLTPGGQVERIAWTRLGSGDGFLVLDRNHNGSIDDGSELFGDATAQPPSDEPNGFLALQVFDGPTVGGDGDGWITAADRVFHDLRLWVDVNHDGVSQPGELSSLTSRGIQAIELSPVESRRRDRHGNELRYASRVRRSIETSQAVDVFFVQR